MMRRTSGWVLATTVLLVSACGGATDGSDTVETTVETTPTTAGAAAEETTTVAETTMAPETTEAPDTTRSDGYDYGPSNGDSTTSSSSSTSTTPDDDEDGDDGATGGASLVVAEGEMGSYLTTADGFSVYLFLPDEQGESTCYDDCEGSWPPMTGDVSAGEGVDDSLLGTTTREDGSEQVTYNDWPLYFFANDAAPGDTNGQGVGDVWYLVTPDGEQLP